MAAVTWAELAGLSLARQFPRVEGRDAAAVAACLAAVGPVQAQTARSVFLCLAARMPGVEYDAVTAAYEDLLIVRGSTLRGTVHTSIAADHPGLEVATRLGQRPLWLRMIKPERSRLEDLWDGIEDFARDAWRTPAELSGHVDGWLRRHDSDAAADRLQNQAGRYFGFGHGGLVRRPLRGGWEGQGAPGYRTASALLGDRSAVLADPGPALLDVVRGHLRRHGPSSRADVAWWSGLGLASVDDLLDRLAPELVSRPGPDGLDYHDLAGPVSAAADPGVRLLPEFDGLLCGYAPAGRERFVDAQHYPRLWNADNGLLAAPLLVDGRLTGWWRAPGTARKRDLEVTWFAGTRRPRKAELGEAVDAVRTALGWRLDTVNVVRG